MGTLKEEAMAYVPKQTKNIADLELVNINEVVMQEGTGRDSDNKEFFYNFFVINQEEYRVPATVYKDLKVILKQSPNTQKIVVKKTGKGFSTEYTVIPLM